MTLQSAKTASNNMAQAIRVFLSFVWTATNMWYGSQCLRVLLTCIWPSFLNLNTELANGAMHVYDFVAFIIYFLLCLPLTWFSPENYKRPFMIASVTVASTVFVLLIWSTVRAGGGGALLADVSGVSGVAPAKGGALGWAFVAAVTANIGGIATHMWSQSDYTRYARKPGDQVLAQLVMVPLGTIIVTCIGIVCTACAATLYPQEKKLLWNPYVFLDAVRKYEDTSSARAGVAFAAIAFMISQFGMIVACNLVVAGIDLAALLPSLVHNPTRWIFYYHLRFHPATLVSSQLRYQLYNSRRILQYLSWPAHGHHVRGLFPLAQDHHEDNGHVWHGFEVDILVHERLELACGRCIHSGHVDVFARSSPTC